MHGDEIAYIFGDPFRYLATFTSPDKPRVDQYCRGESLYIRVTKLYPALYDTLLFNDRSP